MSQVQFPNGAVTTINDSDPGARDAAWREWHESRGSAIPPELQNIDEVRAELADTQRQLADALARLAAYESAQENPDGPVDSGATGEPAMVSEPEANEPDSIAPSDASAGTAEPVSEPAAVGDETAAPNSEVAGEPAADAAAGTPDQEPPASPDVDAQPPAEPVVATPAALAHAEETGVDLAQVEGSGVDGKILKADVAAAADATQEPDAQSS